MKQLTEPESFSKNVVSNLILGTDCVHVILITCSAISNKYINRAALLLGRQLFCG